MGTSQSRNALTVTENYCSQCQQNQRGEQVMEYNNIQTLPMSKGAHAIQAMSKIEKPKPKQQEPFHGFCYKSSSNNGPKTVINL